MSNTRFWKSYDRQDQKEQYEYIFKRVYLAVSNGLQNTCPYDIQRNSQSRRWLKGAFFHVDFQVYIDGNKS